MIRHIFLDLDNTCNMLGMHVLACVGCQVDTTTFQQWPLNAGYKVHQVANELLGCKRFKNNAHFWKTITRANWASCPPSEIFPWILHRAARVVGRENVCIATTPTKCPESLSGKLDWIHRFMPPWMHRQYAMTPCKHFFARSDALLIDDVEDNLFRFEAEGGHGILVPRPWNWLRDAEPYQTLEGQLDNLF